MGTVKRPSVELRQACERPDWAQIVANGGPPCFHISTGPGQAHPRFCLRAERWDGHGDAHHPFVSLFDLVTGNSWGGRRPGAGPKPKVDGDVIAALRARKRTWSQIEQELGISRWTAMKALKRAQRDYATLVDTHE